LQIAERLEVRVAQAPATPGPGFEPSLAAFALKVTVKEWKGCEMQLSPQSKKR
jgi:hypothetical protein